MKNYLVLPFFLLSSCLGAEYVTLSKVALVTGQTADIFTSYGRQELNPLVRSQNGKFGVRGTCIKGVLTGSLLTAEQLPYFKKHKKFTTYLNFSLASISTFAVTWNFTKGK